MKLDILDADLVIRLLWSIGIILCGFVLYWLTNRWILVRVRSRVKGNGIHRNDGPTLLYFTSPTCAPCKTIQQPAIDQVRQQFGTYLQVIEINIDSHPDLTDFWGIMSVPTTLIIDSHGQPRHINHGVTMANKLIRQIQAIII